MQQYYKITEIRGPNLNVPTTVNTYYFNSNGSGEISLNILSDGRGSAPRPLVLAVLEQITEEEYQKAIGD